jgi:tetratricopeptide (TPR) repeat protein
MPRSRRFLWALGGFTLLLAAYWNHFNNSFHFDDFHTIEQNLHLRKIENIPRFFSDATMFSNLPTHQVYRPLLTTTLAVDYLRGGGKPFAFHVTTFLFFIVYLAVLFVFYQKVFDGRFSESENTAAVMFATAVYGLHPVCAETINYIVQRAELLSTLGVVAGLAIYAWRPNWRRFGIYLVPVVLGVLAKPPALVFPILLFAFVYLFETRKVGAAVRAAIPSFMVCALLGGLLNAMNAHTFTPGGTSALHYRVTQMYVTLHYFYSFFLPLNLSADSDMQALPGLWDWRALSGLAFLTVTVAVIYWTGRRKETTPISFGLIWFLVALFPTAWMPLAEVANDHRMFFPFAGLTIAVVQAVRLTLRKPLMHRAGKIVITCAAVALLLIEARAVYARNEVWRNEETLWRDVTIKSPENGRGLMNYGLTLMAKGDASGALHYFERARLKLPAWFILEVNLGIAKGELGRDPEAEQHFLRALQLEPARYESHFFYARWLINRTRTQEARVHLEAAVRSNPNTLDARHLLMKVYADQSRWGDLEAVVNDTLRMVPQDAVSLGYRDLRRQHANDVEKFESKAASTPTPEAYLSLSLAYYQAGRYSDCIAAARNALRLKPDYAEAYNNIAAAYNSMQRWDEGIRAADEALRINPGYELARNNRAWAVAQKSRGQ